MTNQKGGHRAEAVTDSAVNLVSQFSVCFDEPLHLKLTWISPWSEARLVMHAMPVLEDRRQLLYRVIRRKLGLLDLGTSKKRQQFQGIGSYVSIFDLFLLSFL